MENFTEVFQVVQSVWEFVLAAAGIGSVIVMLVNGLKKVEIKGAPLVEAGSADKWYKNIQFGVFGLLTLLKMINPEIDLWIVDNFAADLSQTYGALTMLILPFVARFAEFLHRIGLRKVALVGKSHSAEAQG